MEGTQGMIDVARFSDLARCPVRALEAWLRRARIDYGAVFRRVTAVGTLEDRLSPQGIRRILRRRADLARLTLPAGARLALQGLAAPDGAAPRPPRVRR